MRPKKQINPGAHRSGAADRTSKGRYFVTGLPAAPPEHREVPRVETPRESKYVGRASVGPRAHDFEPVIDELGPGEWVDPLDEEEIDLTKITIDLRPSMVDEPPASYYQRFSSRVPGRQ